MLTSRSNLGVVPALLLAYPVLCPGPGNQDTDPPAAWLAEDPPAERTVFAPYVISHPDLYEYGCWTSADGREAIFGVELGHRSDIRRSLFEDGSWTEPEILLEHEVYRFHDPCLSADGARLYFVSDRPIDGVGPPKDSDLWYAERQGDGWSEPIRLPDTVNSPANDYYTSLTDEGHLYFARNVATTEGEDSNYDLFRARFVDGEFEPAEPLPGAVNTGAYEADPFVAPDESWLIVCSTRRSGQGRGDLYLSVRDEDGNWSAVESVV